jgi:hypothetical protein
MKKAVTAIKNAPSALKKHVAAALKFTKALPAKLQAKLIFMFEHLAHMQGCAYVAAADTLVLKHHTTASLRNMAVSVFQNKLAPVLTKYFPLMLKASAKTSETKICVCVSIFVV